MGAAEKCVVCESDGAHTASGHEAERGPVREAKPEDAARRALNDAEAMSKTPRRSRAPLGDDAADDAGANDAADKRPAAPRGRPPKSEGPPCSLFEHPTPPMKVYLFGGLRVYIGSERVPDKKWRKAKAKVLFGHLITHFGSEVAREILMDSLWPDSDSYRALDNLYVLWSTLKKTVSNQYGECPYVVSNGSLYRIDSSLVESDVEEFERLTRKILFDKPPCSELEAMFVQMDQLYAGDLLAGVKCDDYLLSLRKRYRDTYVDCLVSASRVNRDERNYSEALWFARKALSVDATREDVYQTLMISQAKAGQRSSAIETYLQCRDYMDAQLGLPLSKQTLEIYQKIIEDEIESLR